MKLRRLFPFILVALCLPARLQAATNYFVSPQGDDRNPGTDAKPFRTLNAARAAVRANIVKGLPAGGVTVWLHGGLYLQEETFRLTSEDSGTKDSPVIYRAMKGESPRIFGGIRLAPEAFKPVPPARTLTAVAPEVRAHVLEAQMPARGPYPPRPADVFRGSGGLFRLFFDDRSMPVSRWPHDRYTTMQSVLESGINPPAGGSFIYREEVASHAERWKAAAEQGRLWLAGFWRVPFDISSLRVDHVDIAKRSMTFAAPLPLGIGSKYVEMLNGTRPGDGKEKYYAFNLVEEIDRPGQWSYDFRTRTISFWPPVADALQRHELLLATLIEPVITLRGAKFVTLQGLTIEGSLREGVLIQEGEHNLVAGCVIRNTGGGGVDVEGGMDNRIQSNDLMHLGTYGIRLVAGVRKSLTAGQAVADNNHIFYIGEQERITEGIYLGGVGNKATHNLIHDVPYNGIRYQDNDQYMAYNELHHIGLDAGDMGVFYTNGDWAAQGNRIEYNLAHHSPNANGSYLDDGASGRTTVNNVFYKLASGIFLGGGHNNRIEGNMIVECRLGIHVDNRGVARHYDQNARHLVGTLQTIDPDSPPWSSRYPGFLNGIVDDPTQPTNNIFVGNALVGDPTPYQVNLPAIVDPETNPVISGEPEFRHAATLDLRLEPSSAVLRQLPSFPTIQPDKFGLYLDAFRSTLPTAEETGRYVDRDGMQQFDSNIDVKASDRVSKPHP